MPAPRVLVITPDFPPDLGGIQVLLHRLVAGWTQVEPTVLTLGGAGTTAFDAAQPFPVRRISVEGLPRAAAIVKFNAAALGHGTCAKPNLVLSGHVVAAPAAVLLRRLRGIPFAQYLYAKEVDGRPGLTRLGVRHAARVIAISGYTAGLARACGASETGLRTILPGVDLAPPSGIERASRPTVVTVGRLRDPYKGHDTMLAALPALVRQVPDLHWVVIGDGPLRPELEAAATRHGVGDRITFAGAISDAERDDWLDRAWVFSMPSRVPPGTMSGEGFGIVFLEAGAHGLPVVAGGVGGAVDAVVDGETGVLIDPTDPIALADALAALLSDRVRAERMGAAGRARAASLAWPLVARQVEDELLTMLDGG